MTERRVMNWKYVGWNFMLMAWVAGSTFTIGSYIVLAASSTLPINRPFGYSVLFVTMILGTVEVVNAEPRRGE